MSKWFIGPLRQKYDGETACVVHQPPPSYLIFLLLLLRLRIIAYYSSTHYFGYKRSAWGSSLQLMDASKIRIIFCGESVWQK